MSTLIVCITVGEPFITVIACFWLFLRYLCNGERKATAEPIAKQGGRGFCGVGSRREKKTPPKTHLRLLLATFDTNFHQRCALEKVG